MGLDRDELAARLAGSILTGYATMGPVMTDRNRLAADAIFYADGLLTALTPPAPVAPDARPTHVKITGPVDACLVTVGKVYPVVDWDTDCDRGVILNDSGERWLLAQMKNREPTGSRSFPAWEPAPAPTKVSTGLLLNGNPLCVGDEFTLGGKTYVFTAKEA